MTYPEYQSKQKEIMYRYKNIRMVFERDTRRAERKELDRLYKVYSKSLTSQGGARGTKTFNSGANVGPRS